jgi:hypothetical protein
MMRAEVGPVFSDYSVEACVVATGPEAHEWSPDRSGASILLRWSSDSGRHSLLIIATAKAGTPAAEQMRELVSGDVVVVDGVACRLSWPGVLPHEVAVMRDVAAITRLRCAVQPGSGHTATAR